MELTGPAGGPPVVTDAPDEAAALVAAGHAVVLILAPGAVAPHVADGPGGGRLAVLVGTPGDPAARVAAVAMAADVFAAER